MQTVNTSAGALTPAMEEEVTFLTGVDANGRIAAQSFWRWNYGTPAGYQNTNKTGKWGTPTAGTGATVNYYFDPNANFSAAEQQYFSTLFGLWSAVANVQFTPTTYRGAAALTIQTWDKHGMFQGVASGSNRNGSVGSTTLNQFTTGMINVDSWQHPDPALNGQWWYVLLHEIGHILGLGHSGPYDGGNINTMTQQLGPYDTEQWTLMSYIRPEYVAQYASQYSPSGTSWPNLWSTTWMPVDILAMQRLYGKPVSTPLSGGQTFGFNCNVVDSIAAVFDFTKNSKPIITIWDAGTGNTLDLSGFSATATVNLNPGTFSSVAGLTNNLAIAFDTAIDTLVCGSGNSTVVCNSDGDVVRGGGGSDTITSGAGNDTLDGGAGTDTAVFSGNRSAYTITKTGAASFTLSGPDGSDSLTNIEYAQFADQTISLIAKAARDFDGNAQSDILLCNTSTGQNYIWQMNGAAIASGAETSTFAGNAWTTVATGDFNGDGKADILLQNGASRELYVWTMSGTSVLSSSGAVGTNPGASWQIAATGDFNGDGKTDILLHNAGTGQNYIWMMNASAIGTGSGETSTVAGTDWQIAGTGDFNGDGKADILLQNNATHDIYVWMMSGTSVLSSSGAIGTNPGSSWRVAATGDFDGDGKTDILLANPTTGQTYIWLMDGTNAKTDSGFTSTTAGTAWQEAATGDFNGDGKTDILLRNTATNELYVWMMSGTNVLSSSGSLGTNPGASWQVFTGTGC